MVRILRAFAWMRWRMLINAFEKTGSRDVVERFSIAIEKLGPIMAALLIVPSALALTALSVAAGFAVARGEEFSILFVATRYILFFGPIAAILGPLFLPSGDRTNPVRLLLLPIPRSTIYVAQAAATLGEPWMILVVPPVAGFPVGLLAGGALTAALVSLIAGVLLLAVTIGIATLATTLLHLAVRDRRRAELLGMVFILLISMAGLLPGMLQGSRERTADGRRARRDVTIPAWVEQGVRRVLAVAPSELYVGTIRQAATGAMPSAATSALSLVAIALAIHGLGFVAFARVLEGPGAASTTRGRAGRIAWGRRLPGLSAGASAVALAHVRLTLRTTRGRTGLISPLMMLAVFSVLALRDGGGFDFGGFRLQDGTALATFTALVALLSMIPIAMNQFAVDRSGLTLVLLSPLPERDLIMGKAAGQALVSLPMAFFCIVASRLMFPGGSGAVWLSIPLAITAVYLVVAPAAAAFSAIFPKLVDLSSIGGRGNAHGLAGFLGLLGFVVSGAPCALLVALATTWLHRPWLAPLFLLGWCVVSFVIARLLMGVALRVFMARRENLAMLVSRVPSSGG